MLQITYWNTLSSKGEREGVKGLSQVQIPNSRLIVIRSDAYHVAAANGDECVTHTLAFLKEQK